MSRRSGWQMVAIATALSAWACDDSDRSGAGGAGGAGEGASGGSVGGAGEGASGGSVGGAGEGASGGSVGGASGGSSGGGGRGCDDEFECRGRSVAIRGAGFADHEGDEARVVLRSPEGEHVAGPVTARVTEGAFAADLETVAAGELLAEVHVDADGSGVCEAGEPAQRVVVAAGRTDLVVEVGSDAPAVPEVCGRYVREDLVLVADGLEAQEGRTVYARVAHGDLAWADAPHSEAEVTGGAVRLTLPGAIERWRYRPTYVAAWYLDGNTSGVCGGADDRSGDASLREGDGGLEVEMVLRQGGDCRGFEPERPFDLVVSGRGLEAWEGRTVTLDIVNTMTDEAFGHLERVVTDGGFEPVVLEEVIPLYTQLDAIGYVDLDGDGACSRDEPTFYNQAHANDDATNLREGVPLVVEPSEDPVPAWVCEHFTAFDPSAPVDLTVRGRGFEAYEGRNVHFAVVQTMLDEVPVSGFARVTAGGFDLETEGGLRFMDQYEVAYFADLDGDDACGLDDEPFWRVLLDVNAVDHDLAAGVQLELRPQPGEPPPPWVCNHFRP